MRRTLPLLSTALSALALSAAAMADKPSREPPETQVDQFVPADQCGFPVRVHTEGFEIQTTFFDTAGNVAKLMGIFPANKETLTSLATGKSTTVTATGPFVARLAADGSGVVQLTGHGTFVPNPVTGEPGIWYSSGRVRADVDADGNPTSVDFAGTFVNLCSRLAPGP